MLCIASLRLELSAFCDWCDRIRRRTTSDVWHCLKSVGVEAAYAPLIAPVSLLYDIIPNDIARVQSCFYVDQYTLMHARKSLKRFAHLQ